MKLSAILSTVSFSPAWLLQLPQPHRASAALSKLSTVIFDCNRPFDVSSMFCRRGCYRLELCAPVFCLIILFRAGSFTGALGISLASFMKLMLRGKCRLWCMLHSHVILYRSCAAAYTAACAARAAGADGLSIVIAALDVLEEDWTFDAVAPPPPLPYLPPPNPCPVHRHRSCPSMIDRSLRPRKLFE